MQQYSGGHLIRYFITLTMLAGLFISQHAIAANDDRGVSVTEKNRDSRKRVALVIGNSTYRSSPLKNPANDARAIASSLRRLGFEVEEKTDLGYIEMNKSIESFGKKLRSGGIGLFYYAGHGMQVNGANYLIPVDAQIEDENEVRFKALDAGLVLAKMEQARSDVNIVVLDACRDNPFSRSFRSASRGLASIDAPSGTFIAYATAPGKTAADGEEKNGLYTAELVKVLETPGIPLEQVFKRTLKAVREKSGSKQTPWVASNLEGEFFFTSPSSMTNLQPSEPQPVSSAIPKSSQTEDKNNSENIASTEATKQKRINSITTTENGIEIEISGFDSFKSNIIKNPGRLIIDCYGIKNIPSQRKVEINKFGVDKAYIKVYTDKVRIVFGSIEQSFPSHQINNHPGGITISFTNVKEFGPPADYLKAFDLYIANEFSVAIDSFETFLTANPQSDYAVNAHFWIGECYFTLSNPPKAKEAFLIVTERYPNSSKAPDALLKLGYLAAMKDKEESASIFNRLLSLYPNSPAAKKARERLSSH